MAVAMTTNHGHGVMVLGGQIDHAIRKSCVIIYSSPNSPPGLSY